MKVSALITPLSLALGCLPLVHGLAAENSSLSDSNLETAATKVMAETSLSQNDLLRKQLSLDRETQKTLTESLVVSNAEAELFRRKYSELQLRMEALGVEAVSKDRAKLEQRLLKAVSDLQLMNKETSAYREQLLKLTETMLRFVKSTQSADPQARMGQRTPDATHLIKVCCQAALGMRDAVSVFGTDYPTPDGTGIRDYIHIEDLASAHLSALSHLERGGDSSTFNVGYGQGASVREVIKVVKEVAGVDFRVVEAPRRPGDPASLVAKADRIRELLGWQPRYNDLRTIVADAWRWEQRLTGKG